MAQTKVKRAIVTGSTVLGLLLLVIFGVIVVQALIGENNNTDTQQTTPADSSHEEVNEPKSDDTADKKETEKEDEPQLDPATVSSVVISQLNIEVSYVKGINGFEYAIKRTPRGGQYVEFKNEEVKGTKCTDDQGVFASIIEQPDATEAATITKRMTVEGVEYGLALASTNCTSDTALLQKYQDSFSQAFGLLKRPASVQE